MAAAEPRERIWRGRATSSNTRPPDALFTAVQVTDAFFAPGAPVSVRGRRVVVRAVVGRSTEVVDLLLHYLKEGKPSCTAEEFVKNVGRMLGLGLEKLLLER